MLKAILEPVIKVLKGRLKKSGLKEKLLKHPKYLEKSKEIWAMIDEDYKISEKVDSKLKSKVDKFDKTLLAMFPELTKDDVVELRQNIFKEINIELINQLSQVKSTDDQNASEVSNEGTTSTNMNIK